MLAYQAISRDWLRSPSEQDRRSILEYSRGVVYGLSFTSERNEVRSRPIHVNRIRSAFSDLGAPAIYRVGLRLLSLLGEAQPLAGGYWLIAPFRVIPLNSMHAFVGCAPSSAISTGATGCSGLARLVDEGFAADYPIQNLEGWMGKRTSSPSEYVEDLVQTYRASAAPAVSSSETEYLHLVSKNANASHALWSDKPVAIVPHQRLAICRQSNVGSYRYFVAELSNGRVVAESSLRHSLPRLIWGLASCAATPFRVTSQSVETTTRIRVPVRLPSEEYRLALLLSTSITRQGASTIYEMDAGVSPLFENELKTLGCHWETNS